MMATGDELEAMRCLDSLEKMKKEENFRELLIEAKAEQAYYYSRLGGPENVKMAISLFSVVVAEKPDNYLWKFGLGLACRRATHANIFCSSTDRVDVEKWKIMATRYLFEIAKNADRRLQALAYAQLVLLRFDNPRGLDPELDELFRDLEIEQLCEKSLEIGNDIPSVLTHCSKYLRTSDVDKSIELLEKSIKISPKSICYQSLGNSYIKKAKLLNSNHCVPSTEQKGASGLRYPEADTPDIIFENQEEVYCYLPQRTSDRSKSHDFIERHGKGPGRGLKNNIHMCVSSPTTGSLNKDDELVKRAKECFIKAIESKKENFPAILDLGNLLKETGEIQEAVKIFNKLTNDFLFLKNHRLTLISAYEQAGLCYLELSKLNPRDIKYEKMGKDNLTQAVSLAAELAVITPELQDIHEFWTAFRTLTNEIDREPLSSEQQKKKIKLLELAGNYGQIIEVVQKLREFSEDQLNDQNIVAAALNSYLKENQPENALAFMNLIGIRPDIGDWWTTSPVCALKINVLLETVSGRLKASTENPTMLFQQLFELTRGECRDLYAHELDQTTKAGNSEAENLARHVIGDVLVVYDGDFDSEESPSLTMKSARCLKEVSTRLFGLEAEENLKGSGEFGDFQAEIQLKVMKKYQVIIVLGSEIRDYGIFDAVLKCLSSSKSSANLQHQRIVIMDAGLQESRVPLSLTQYECLKLEDIGGLGDIAQVPGFMEDDGQLSFVDILHHVFHGDVDTVMKLFCFMIGQQWPCT